MSGSVDVVVLGGGIAGSSLATVMVRDGYQVVVLERQTTYRDRVRGEWLACWGVAELLRLNLDKPLLDAGGCYVTRAVPYDEVTNRRTPRQPPRRWTTSCPACRGCYTSGILRPARR